MSIISVRSQLRKQNVAADFSLTFVTTEYPIRSVDGGGKLGGDRVDKERQDTAVAFE